MITIYSAHNQYKQIMTFTQARYEPECFLHHSAGHLNCVENFSFIKAMKL